ncbi:hypothetical protein L227DRAFT_68786 [Lentinus tigrinus ALCF2SS1-6]|uniref:Uncharacterized protein n=1 Tax=Lentinus tigrinus ALCF2SS1-6 TaxID=1328759 RepID=A0A5C2SCM3_9APHY|nr:hypothetical protein L227DRAFT_68786 [Lentinus tigrinus ALCF2SS1-6]
MCHAFAHVSRFTLALRSTARQTRILRTLPVVSLGLVCLLSFGSRWRCGRSIVDVGGRVARYDTYLRTFPRRPSLSLSLVQRRALLHLLHYTLVYTRSVLHHHPHIPTLLTPPVPIPLPPYRQRTHRHLIVVPAPTHCTYLPRTCIAT